MSAELKDGLGAYAREQSAIERERAEVWETEWLLVRVRAREVLAYLDGKKDMPSSTLDVELEDDDEDFDDIAD